MLFLIGRRLLMALATIWAMTVVVFVGTEVLPGDVAQAVLGQNATEGALRQLREELKLERSPVERYLHWIGGVAKGDLGKSWTGSAAHRNEVSTLVGERLKNTAILGVATALVAVPLALILGLLSAMYEGRVFDRAVNAVALCGISVPEFFTAALLVSVLTVQLGWLPGIANIRPGQSIGTTAYALTLPVMTLTAGMLAHMSRMTRGATLTVLALPYAEMARLKGMRPWRVIYYHALPNAFAPIVNVVALNLAYLVSGVVVVETVFAYPGLGKLMVDSVSLRDVPVVQACAIIFCGVYVTLNTIADILAMLSNPRILYPR